MAHYKVSENLALSDSGFVFSPITGESFTLNAVGLFIINKLKLNSDLDSVIDEVLDEFDVERNIAERDAADFISQLKHFKLVAEK